MAKKAYENDTSFMGLKFRGSVNMKGKLDLIPYLETKKDFPKPMEKHIDKDTVLREVAQNQDEVIKLLKMDYIHSPLASGWGIASLFITWVVCLFLTTFIVSMSANINLWVGMTLFSISSISFGPLLALVMLEMDENDGFTALKIVLVVTLITGFIGYGDFVSFSESSAFGLVLIVSLFGLLIFNFSRYYMEFSRKAVRRSAIFGAILFSLFLLYDFNYIKMQSSIYAKNDWSTALEMAFILYLDIINLLLEILEAMGNS
tara:strand:- start:57 stop:836 length:780 start_codon:yes stop_codon:yes gene_type:complete